jgi:hypothetical protein
MSCPDGFHISLELCNGRSDSEVEVRKAIGVDKHAKNLENELVCW